MGYATASTIWPSLRLSAEVRNLIDTFFTLADSKASDAGERLAKDAFTGNAVFRGANGTFQGSSGKTADLRRGDAWMLIFYPEIYESRKNAWKTVKYRQHQVLKVYVNDADTTDLFIVGSLTMEDLEGVKSSREFVARMEVEQVPSVGFKIRQYSVVNPAPQDRASLLERK